ncbi:hypothetical protein C3Y87_14835 [Carbonactinospora thermoautotrophica]|uniref:helix-turn-helix domain-containing protein n=1 Tax=Carbonactinospora thermoautotrophica TaxID=1469144 RepID=UPI00226F8077|nr:helix-turn-helix transcriptional regulator [Carbonactinospora thermoautotrophica]MCX9192666.1 hypothetical protein [Carbonactinospora thermoautotrophica]
MTGEGPNHTLRRLRQQRNLSQAELAEEIRDTAQRMGLHLACDEKRIGRWERGEVRWPSPRTGGCCAWSSGSRTPKSWGSGL